MTERAKPFVAWTSREDLDALRAGGSAWLVPTSEGMERVRVPVVVTPLLPDDPRPGETWIADGGSCTILSAPYVASNHVGVVVSSKAWTAVRSLCELRRPPVLKTFRVTLDTKEGWAVHREIKAESREAALAKLAESLEEVEP